MTPRRRLFILIAALALLVPSRSLAANVGTCFEDEFAGTTLDLSKWDVFHGSPTVGNQSLTLAAKAGTRAEIQSRTLCMYQVLHMVISSSDWKSQTGPDKTTDSTFGFEHFTGSNGQCHYGVVPTANGHLGLLRPEPDAQGACHGDPAHQPYTPIDNWNALMTRGRLYVTLIWTASGATIHVTDGGLNSGTASSADLSVLPDIPLKIRLNADCKVLTGDCISTRDDSFRIEYVRVGTGLARPRLNQTSFRSRDALRLSSEIQNIGAGFNADFFMGVLLPDGMTVCFFVAVSPVTCAGRTASGDPATFPPLVFNAFIPQGADGTFDGLPVSYTFSGVEPAGTYTVFTALTQPGTLTDHNVDAADVRAINSESFSFSP